MKNDSEDVATLGRRIVQALSGFAEIEQLVLFGSLAQGSGRPDSAAALRADLDAQDILTLNLTRAIQIEAAPNGRGRFSCGDMFCGDMA